MATNNFNDLNLLDGLQFIPVNAMKVPVVKDWQTTVKKYDLSKSEAVGLVCGEPSGNLEALDFDLKYDLTGELYEKYKKIVHAVSKELMLKMVVQKTRSGGFHWLYRCEKNEGNQKLANRPTTAEEKQETFEKEYKSSLFRGLPDDDAKRIAAKASGNDKVRVLIETRGIGGQIVISPSNGYLMTFGDLMSISQISVDERNILHDIARQFNEFFEEAVIPKPSTVKKDGLSPCDDFNDRGDVVEVLQNNGWKVVKQKGNKTLFLRPGQTTAQTSGNYDHEKRWFSVFSTSTEFESQKSYLPYAVFAKLECSDNFSEATKKLYDLGFGDRREEKKVVAKESTRAIKSRIDLETEDYSFLAEPKDYDGYLQQVIDGTLPMGLTTGSRALDEYFMFKEGSLVMINGHDNTGKTKFILWLLLIASMYHNWEGIIFSSENTLGSFMRTMIQFYWGRPLRGRNAINQTEYKIAKDFIEKKFHLIKAQEDLFNYKDVINMCKKARKQYPSLKYCMIDPYNSLKIDLSGFSKLSTHEYHYEALSEIKSYGQQTKFGWFVNHHAVTAALRAKDGEKKYPVAPQKADTEGGGKVSNKADDFLTIHRVTQHPTDWMVTEVHVRKIKETETGGKVTPFDMPVKFEMYRDGCGFIERTEGWFTPVDPIDRWHRLQKGEQFELEVSKVDLPIINFNQEVISYNKNTENNIADEEAPF